MVPGFDSGLAWRVLAQGLLFGCSQGISWGCRYLKALLQVEDLLLKMFTHVAVGRRPQFLTTWVFLLGCPRVFVMWYLIFPKNSDLRERKESKKLQCPSGPRLGITHHHFCFLHFARRKWRCSSSPHLSGGELSSASQWEECLRI